MVSAPFDKTHSAVQRRVFAAYEEAKQADGLAGEHIAERSQVADERKKLFSEIPCIEGERIVLDRVVDTDADALRDLTDNPHAQRYLPAYLFEKQFDDLDRARASLDRTITKLDDIARSRYLDTFARIQKNFQFVFSKLFLNGETKMSLVEKVDEMGKPMDILDADIEINVRPTGKKMRGIKALSGGEHALTATALLFAIYMEKPSPYCVLDEVDGPLDDANVGRFMALLREFSKQTLFIVVTHNKRTMAEADMLYGVTQEIKGISRIASVQLADATKFAI